MNVVNPCNLGDWPQSIHDPTLIGCIQGKQDLIVWRLKKLLRYPYTKIKGDIMKMMKKMLLIVLALLPISSVAFAAQSALTVAQAESEDAVQTTPSVSWTNGNKK